MLAEFEVSVAPEVECKGSRVDDCTEELGVAGLMGYKKVPLFEA